MNKKPRATRNRTLCLEENEMTDLEGKLTICTSPVTLEDVVGKTINQDLYDVLPYLPSSSVDLMIVDPPYNLNKSFNGKQFRKMPDEKYKEWIESWFQPLMRLLKPTASLYVCCDWKCSSQIQHVLSKYAIVRNRITWEREKGRGAKSNWKNCSEDIWFATVSDKYCFNVEAVKLKRQVLAPYTRNGSPKDWAKGTDGNFRLTHPSNIWTDISVPFWSMPENTDHPTQKSEKLIAKLILASSNEGDVVFDPFLGAGTTSVVAKKLNRCFFGVEIETEYCCLTEKRLELAEFDSSIQGYTDGLFWERNSLKYQKKTSKTAGKPQDHTLFELDG